MDLNNSSPIDKQGEKTQIKPSLRLVRATSLLRIPRCDHFYKLLFIVAVRFVVESDIIHLHHVVLSKWYANYFGEEFK